MLCRCIKLRLKAKVDRKKIEDLAKLEWNRFNRFKALSLLKLDTLRREAVIKPTVESQF
jgi:hypothetical protein